MPGQLWLFNTITASGPPFGIFVPGFVWAAPAPGLVLISHSGELQRHLLAHGVGAEPALTFLGTHAPSAGEEGKVPFFIQSTIHPASV